MRLYADHNATAPLRPEARAAMQEALDWVGNPSSAHREGVRARRALEAARAQVAGLIGATPTEIVFTSGATEANALALHGAPLGDAPLITSPIEHASVVEPAQERIRLGGDVRWLQVDQQGRIEAADVTALCQGRACFTTLGLANGEVGAIAPIAAVAKLAHAHGGLLHTDAAQAAGRVPIDVRELGVDLLSLSGHKLGGPAGVGALYVRRDLSLTAMLGGGSQERGRRAGTENLIGIVGFGAAAAAAHQALPEATVALCRRRDRLWAGLRASLPDLVRNGPDTDSLPNTLNVTVPGVSGASLLVLLDLAGVAASLGSACSAGSHEASHVLLAMGRDDGQARSGLRLSLGHDTSDDDVARLIEIIPAVVSRARAGVAA